MGSKEFEDIGIRWCEAMCRGDFAEAWRQTDTIEHERRAREQLGGFVRKAHHLIWDGTPFEDRTALVRCEHGLGDTLQFIRYVPLLRKVAAAVTVLVQPPLLDLLSDDCAFGDVRNGWLETPPEPHDVEIEVMELSYAFRSRVETLPTVVPYLPLAKVNARAAELSGLLRHAPLRVGLLWAASDWDSTRSVPIELLEPLAACARGVEFFSLQQGDSEPQWARAPFRITPLSAYTRDVVSAAAVMSQLDVIITVDSMIAHLAGALGRPVWVLLQHACDWRWMKARPDSPWYPSMRLFRQAEPGDWPSAVRALAGALGDQAQRISASHSVRK